MKAKFIVRGGRPLQGEVEVCGSKNAATKMMIASLLTDEPCTIENVPRSLDVDITSELCERVGSVMLWDGAHRILIRTPEVKTSLVPELSRGNRIPILALGPLLHRKKIAEVPVLGGCPIGHRPINLHIEALNRMGVRVERRENSYYAEADEIRGAEIEFPFPSVGATENVILTAVLAKGRTAIKNAAVEPEVMNMVAMLQEMGAEIHSDIHARRIEVDGVSNLSGVRVRVMPDRNEVISFAVAAHSTNGDVLVSDIGPEYLETFLKVLTDVGAPYEVGGRGIRFFGKRPYNRISLTTSSHPGFMTDWASPFCVLLTQAQGESIIHETVYEDRLGYVKDLNRMGASIMLSDECLLDPRCRFFGQTFNHSARITGPTSLHGDEIVMRDVRAGMAHLVAALAADGESVISGVEHLDRGYENIDERLRALGADIKRLV